MAESFCCRRAEKIPSNQRRHLKGSHLSARGLRAQVEISTCGDLSPHTCFDAFDTATQGSQPYFWYYSRIAETNIYCQVVEDQG